ncbi:MAG: hypothetical protein IBX56_20025 [Methylomicrobium sp.]|nr:hypothetical protein [Methylomicrobium sp.]
MNKYDDYNLYSKKDYDFNQAPERFFDKPSVQILIAGVVIFLCGGLLTSLFLLL